MPGQARSDNSDRFKDRLLIEQVTLVCRFAALPLVGTLFIGGVLCWVLLAENPTAAVAWWFGAVLAAGVVRVGLGWRFLARPRTARDAHRWRIALVCAAAATGSLWGYGSTGLMPQDPSRELVASLFFIGAAATGAATLAPLRFCYGALLIPFLVPYVVHQFLLGGERVAAGYGTTLYILLMLIIARTYRNSVREILSLRLTNEALAERLSGEKSRVEAANEDLKRQIAERERVESQLIAAKLGAEAASRAKTQFLANMSHEVRTPMNAIMGMTELLLRTPLELKQRRFVRIALEAGERLMHLIDDVLDLARVEAGKLRISLSDFSPRSLLQEVGELMSPLATKKGLTLTQHVADDVPRSVRGDPYRVRQILVNLISNAIKFTDRGTVRVELQVVDASAGPDEGSVRLRWSVIDTGVGVEPRAHARLFAPFSQADDSTTRRHGGTGLGLAICRQVVEAMDGVIDFSSEAGRGSAFWFELSLDVVDSHARRGFIKHPAPSQPACRGRVLVVEDNPVNRVVLEEMLPILGAEVTVAETGTQALTLIAEQTFDLVLMDWHMPDLDGLEATRRIREAEAAAPEAREGRLPIVALTASAMPGDRDACLAAGMDDYLAKPFTHDELAAVLERWLGISATRVA